MKVTLLTLAGAICLACASPASAEGWSDPHHCWWDGGGMRCLPGYHWDHDQRREEWREREERHERMEQRRELCDRHPWKCW